MVGSMLFTGLGQFVFAVGNRVIHPLCLRRNTFLGMPPFNEFKGCFRMLRIDGNNPNIRIASAHVVAVCVGAGKPFASNFVFGSCSWRVLFSMPPKRPST